MAKIVDSIRPGDRVTIVDRFGAQRSGRAVMRGPHGWVLNMGGRHGTPGIASDANIVGVKPTKRPGAKGGLGMTKRHTYNQIIGKPSAISLIVKGPIKSAKRAASRHGVALESCRNVGSGKFGDVQCYARCHPKTNHGVVDWMHDRARSKAGRGFPPGTLLYHGAMCSKDLSGKKRR